MSSASQAVFLSYASQDAEAARRICDALRAAGVEVWFDQNELVGGDAWDAKIRGQIAACALFVPVISANTEARDKGYFRREWKLAVDCTHDMADDVAYLLPVVIDGTADATARVPDKFREVQWTRLAGGENAAGFCERVLKLLDAKAHPRVPSVAAGINQPGARPFPARSRRRFSPGILLGVACVAVAAGIFAWRLAHLGGRPQSKAQPSAAATVPPTEARKLVLQARALIDDDLLAGRENFRLADELCQRATALDPADGEAWATHARVSLEMIDRNYDAGLERRNAARNQADRALRLLPESIEAGLAMAGQQLASDNPADAALRYRSLLKIAPGDGRVALGLARALDRIDQRAEAREIRLTHPAFAGRDPRPLVDEVGWLRDRAHLVESDELIDRAQAIAPTLRGYFYKLANLANQWATWSRRENTWSRFLLAFGRRMRSPG